MTWVDDRGRVPHHDGGRGGDSAPTRPDELRRDHDRPGRLAVGLTGVVTLVVAIVAMLALGGSGGGDPGTSRIAGQVGQVRLDTQEPDAEVDGSGVTVGRLVVTSNGCLAVRGVAGDVVAVVWPPGWTGDRGATGAVRLLDADGAAAAFEGDWLTLRGRRTLVAGAPACSFGLTHAFHVAEGAGAVS